MKTYKTRLLLLGRTCLPAIPLPVSLQEKTVYVQKKLAHKGSQQLNLPRQKARNDSRASNQRMGKHIVAYPYNGTIKRNKF